MYVCHGHKIYALLQEREIYIYINICKWIGKLRLFLSYISTDKVAKKKWGTTWRVTDEVVTWRISTTEAPIIPAWYRYTLDKQHVLCLC